MSRKQHRRRQPPSRRRGQPALSRRRAHRHGQCHPRAGDGRGRAGEIRPSRPADGRGRRRDRAVHAVPEIRSGGPGLARPRPLRALGRPRLDAALRAALSHRLCGDDASRRSSASASSARRRRAIRNTATRRASRRRPARSGKGSPTRSAWRLPSGIWRRSSADIVDHSTYVLASDGDLMEGISQEAIALAGHLKLNQAHRAVRRQRHFDRRRAVAVRLRRSGEALRSGGWNASRIDGHDAEAIAAATRAKAQSSGRPVLIACKTTIGFGAPTKAGKATAHGSPLGADEIKGAREKLGWTHPPFEIPADILAAWRVAGAALEGSARRLEQAPRRARRGQARRVRAAHAAATCRKALNDAVRAVKQSLAATPKEIATPHGVRIRAREPDPGGAGDDRRLGRSHRLQQHQAPRR